MVSDESWATTNEGPLGLNDLQLGEHYDARRSLENASWHDVAVRDFALDNLVGSDCQPIREQEQFPARLIHTPNGEKVLDFGQNFAGYVRMEFDARGSETLILTHGESLDKNGNFTQANILAPTKPAAYQQVFYTCKQGRNVYQPSMCFFGFRYVRVETSMEVNPEWFTGVAVYSDMKQTAQFSCGNEKVNQLFQNCLWSMKSNFISVMTDCPTRERSGYTGDGQVFCPSGLYLMDCSPVYRHWLQSLKQVFLPDGGLKMFAPERQPASFMDSSHGWCDAIVIIPYLLWKRSGDLQFAADHFDDGKKWVDFALKRASSGSHNVGKRLPKELQPYFADQGFTFGEWLEFSNSSLIAGIIDILKHMLFGEPETATAYLSYSSHLLSQMAAALGKTEDAARYAHAAGMTRQAYRAAYIENGIIREPVRQCRYVRPLALGLLDEGEKPLAVERLVECIVKAGNHLNTGFLSTAYLCRMLSDHGRAAKAYDLLLQETLPSWLYEVKKGATTVWENWRGIDENGKLNNSFNHYSLGAISGWLMDSVCGIRVEDGSLTLAPKPDQRLGFAEGSYESAIGKIRSAWRYEGNALILEGEIPCGIHATLELPGGESKILQSGQYQIFVKETVGM
jgi:alpha-L-rhamnosidase